MDEQKRIRVGYIGLGGRGQGMLQILLQMSDVTVTAVCDRYEDRTLAGKRLVESAGRPSPFCTQNYLEVVSRDDVDCIFTPSSWTSHSTVMIAAMKAGKPVATEVGGAASVQECWDLVHTALETGVPCMMMENCCYNREEMALLNMVRQNVFGELIHCQGGYEHDLRSEVARGIEERHYRFQHYAHRNGDIYPTHALGPIAKLLNINRGNRFISLASFSSKTRGIHEWAVANLGPDHRASTTEYLQGDVVTTILKCARGETVVLTHDTTLPRPYSRGLRVQGTKGIFLEDNYSVYLEGRSPKLDAWDSFKDYIDEFDHPLWKKSDVANFHEGHGGMDYLILRAFIEPLQANLKELPIDVYDVATWMAVTPLSEASIAQGGQPVAFPDFTNGLWTNREPASQHLYSLS